MTNHDGCDCNGLRHDTGLRVPRGATRRDILKMSLAGAGIFALGPLGRAGRFADSAFAAPVSAKRMVVINLFGGCDTLNMFIPVNASSYISRRTSASGNIFVDPNVALALNGTTDYRLHPSMPKIAALWNEGSVAAVTRTGYPRANLSHFESQDIFSTGVRNGFGALSVAESGWLARFADAHAPTALGAVGLGVGRPLDFVGGTSNPLAVSSLGAFNISGTAANSTNARLYRTQIAKEALARSNTSGLPKSSRDALDQAYQLTGQVQAAITSYTSQATWSSAFISQRMRDAAILIEGGFSTRIFYTGYGGFDTHGNQGASTGALPSLLTQLDDAIGSFAIDMKNRGLWNDVAIVVITEFGRRNYVNGSAGTDHGHAFTALVAGGAVRGGVYGPGITNSDLSGEYPAYGVDFRSIYKNILQNHLGADPAVVFPEALAIEQNLGIY